MPSFPRKWMDWEKEEPPPPKKLGHDINWAMTWGVQNVWEEETYRTTHPPENFWTPRKERLVWSVFLCCLEYPRNTGRCSAKSCPLRNRPVRIHVLFGIRVSSSLVLQEIRIRFASPFAQGTVGLFPSLRVASFFALRSGFWCRVCFQKSCAICLVPLHLALRSTARSSSPFAHLHAFGIHWILSSFLLWFSGDFRRFWGYSYFPLLPLVFSFFVLFCWCSILLQAKKSSDARGGVENVPNEGGPKPLFGRGVIREVFLPPPFSTPLASSERTVCNNCIPNGNLVDISAPKKIFSPPPPKIPNLPQTPSRPLGPSPPGEPPPLVGFSIKNRPPPSRRPRTPPSPSPSRKKNKKYPKRPPRKVWCWGLAWRSAAFCRLGLDADLLPQAQDWKSRALPLGPESWEKNPILPEQMFNSSPCAPAEARRWILIDSSQGNLVGNLAGFLREFCGIFSDPQKKGFNISGKISEHFSWEIS